MCTRSTCTDSLFENIFTNLVWINSMFRIRRVEINGRLELHAETETVGLVLTLTSN